MNSLTVSKQKVKAREALPDALTQLRASLKALEEGRVIRVR